MTHLLFVKALLWFRSIIKKQNGVGQEIKDYITHMCSVVKSLFLGPYLHLCFLGFDAKCISHCGLYQKELGIPALYFNLYNEF